MQNVLPHQFYIEIDDWAFAPAFSTVVFFAIAAVLLLGLLAVVVVAISASGKRPRD